MIKETVIRYYDEYQNSLDGEGMPLLDGRFINQNILNFCCSEVGIYMIHPFALIETCHGLAGLQSESFYTSEEKFSEDIKKFGVLYSVKHSFEPVFINFKISPNVYIISGVLKSKLYRIIGEKLVIC